MTRLTRRSVCLTGEWLEQVEFPELMAKQARKLLGMTA